MELLIGCGASREKKVVWNGKAEWSELVTLDMSGEHNADIIHNLERLPYPFPSDLFDEIHAYEVLEHTGRQGDWRFFFGQFEEFYRILKPGGVLVGTSPAPHSPWAWGDPGHTRIIGSECFVFLDQRQYAQVGKTPMTDYRPWYAGDFVVKHSAYEDNGQHVYVLQARKGEGNANAA